MSERYSDLYPNISVSYVDKYGYYDNSKLEVNKTEEELNHFIYLPNLKIGRKDILVNLVDNEGFKKQLDAFIVAIGHSALYFSSGLNLFNGQVYYTSTDSDIFSNLYTVDHPDLFNDFEEVSVHACADADANGTDDNPEQMFNGNDLAASFLANMLQTVLSDVIDYQRVNFVSGSNISCQKEGKYYGMIHRYLAYVINDRGMLPEDYLNAISYVNRYGRRKTSPLALSMYPLYDSYEELKNFREFLIGLYAS